MSRRILPYLWTLLFLALAALLSVAIGSVFIPLADLWRVLTGQPPQTVSAAATIIFELRLPRTVLVLLTGAALSGSGAAYQGLFRNPLADPYLIGVASGAGLGAILAMSVHWPYSFWGLMAVPAAAFVGALLTVFIVYSLARLGKTVPTTNLILAGVAFSSFATAVTSFLMLRSTGELRRAIAWMLGGASQAGWGPVLSILPYLAIGLGILLLNGHALNLLQFGDDQAQQLGLHVTRTRTLLLVAASLATAAAVSFSGTIGFVGLIVPHIMRLWFGADYRRLLPLSLIAGAGTLLLADVLARSVLAPQELPVGIVTAIAGAPFFLWVLRRAKNQGYW
ncbi:MAG TPA: iron ABC transporter permease [Anaerolineales bacterium]|nr:iron ABC transporter permease [Anaerolineales bacterium]